MPSWPASLPRTPLLAGQTESPPAVVLRTAMDAGPAKVRRRFTAAVRRVTVKLRLTASQVDTLDRFYQDDLMGGALPFTWTHPRTAAVVQMRLTGLRYAPFSSCYEVQMDLEILP